jgi:hypothetical protein
VTIDELFLFTLEDLEERAELGKGEYDALIMASLLRKLLLDEIPLAHAVNRERREHIRFRVTDLTPPRGVESWAFDDVFHPSGAWPEHTMVDLTLKQFLNRTAVVAFKECVSVRELIKFLAHNYGAVHAFPGALRRRALYVTRRGALASRLRRDNTPDPSTRLWLSLAWSSTDSSLCAHALKARDPIGGVDSGGTTIPRCEICDQRNRRDICRSVRGRARERSGPAVQHAAY